MKKSTEVAQQSEAIGSDIEERLSGVEIGVNLRVEMEAKEFSAGSEGESVGERGMENTSVLVRDFISDGGFHARSC